jgi:hypothetical protein
VTDRYYMQHGVMNSVYFYTTHLSHFYIGGGYAHVGNLLAHEHLVALVF